MEFSNSQLNKFKIAWEKETGKKVSDKKAQELLAVILKLMIPIYDEEL